jgi:hypothetical protein
VDSPAYPNSQRVKGYAKEICDGCGDGGRPDATGGKLANCKVVENTGPAGKGFDKAAVCIADSMPMGSKTGTIRVPFRFSGEG